MDKQDIGFSTIDTIIKNTKRDIDSRLLKEFYEKNPAFKGQTLETIGLTIDYEVTHDKDLNPINIIGRIIPLP